MELCTLKDSGETRGGLMALLFGSLVNYNYTCAKLTHKQRHFEHRWIANIQINQTRILTVSTRNEKRSKKIARFPRFTEMDFPIVTRFSFINSLLVD